MQVKAMISLTTAKRYTQMIRINRNVFKLVGKTKHAAKNFNTVFHVERYSTFLGNPPIHDHTFDHDHRHAGKCMVKFGTNV